MIWFDEEHDATLNEHSRQLYREQVRRSGNWAFRRGAWEAGYHPAIPTQRARMLNDLYWGDSVGEHMRPRTAEAGPSPSGRKKSPASHTGS